jgi:hypothetical protein
MADEQRQESSDSREKSGKRRYFRRRNKNKKPRSGEQTSIEGVAKVKKSGAAATGERKGAPNKKRRSRRRRSSRRTNQQNTMPELIQEPERPYEEPTSVYIYTHIVRPAYRDAISDYRPETSFQQSDDHGSFLSGNIELLTKEIREQLDRQFKVESNDSPAVKKNIEIDEFDEDEEIDSSE